MWFSLSPLRLCERSFLHSRQASPLLLHLLYDDRALTHQGRDRAEGRCRGREQGADHAQCERDLDQRPALLTLDDDAADVALMYQLSDRADELLASVVWSALTRNEETSASYLETVAHKGRVTITGTARSLRILNAITEVAQAVDGVTEVENEVSIGTIWRS